MNCEEFLNAPGVILDVRSPGEYSRGHIPGAHSLPLFSDSERAMIGTLYKQKGQEAAVSAGWELVLPRLATYVQKAKELTQGDIAKVHCWRGGMRSSSMAKLLRMAGMSTILLEGGYKSFRRWCLEKYTQKRLLYVIGGMTGSGKTHILHALRDLGEQVLDLEALASHRGSSYGRLDMPPQPHTEHFQNTIAMHLAQCDPNRPLWVEDESLMIGMCHIPLPFFEQMQASRLFAIERPLSERLEMLYSDYGHVSREDLITATKRIERRLGGKRTAQVIAWIEEGNLRKAAEAVLEYYDKTYRYGLAKRLHLAEIISKEGLSAQEWASLLVESGVRPPISNLSLVRTSSS